MYRINGHLRRQCLCYFLGHSSTSCGYVCFGFRRNLADFLINLKHGRAL